MCPVSMMYACCFPWRPLAGAILGLFVAGCQTLDKISYEPRSYELNLGTQIFAKS